MNVSTNIMDAASVVKNGGLAVIPTDTLYGLVASVANEEAVKRLYKVRKRNWDQKCLILIDSIERLSDFGIKRGSFPSFVKDFLVQHWPGPVSVELPVMGEEKQEEYKFLHKGTNLLLFRIPAHKELRLFLKETGPVLAPSANLPKEEPAYTCVEAQGYFSEDVDVYVDGGQKKTTASQVWVVEGEEMKRLR
jgi:L-threonylcarbamoyladenylate synthase